MTRILTALLCVSAAAFAQGMASRKAIATPPPKASGQTWTSKLTDISAQAGLLKPTIYGREIGVQYLSEISSGGIAFFDYDNDGWLDIFVVSGTQFGANPPEATNRLYRNNHNGTFTDTTQKAGLRKAGWGQGVSVADFDNDGDNDLFITYWGSNILYRNNGDGTFTDITASAGLAAPSSPHPYWFSGATFLDYDRDGHLDLFVATYLDFDLAKVPKPGANPNCNWNGVAVPCGPRGFAPSRHFLYHNRGDGTFEDVSEKSGIAAVRTSFGLTAISADFDRDGWQDIYLACDSTLSLFFRNNHDGTFTEEGIQRGVAVNEDGADQAGMGVAVGDINNDGFLDILKTHFADDTHVLYQGAANGHFTDITTKSGLGSETRYVGWGAGMPDLDNDGWPDLFIVTGNVYPNVERTRPAYPYKTPPLLFRNLGGGRFEPLPVLTGRHSARGAAFGDFDNDGDVDVVIWNRNEPPSLLRNDLKSPNHWLEIKLIGKQSNRSAIGATVTLEFANNRQAQVVMSQSSYTSASDQRLHFGLGAATTAHAVIHWPNGNTERFTIEQVDRLITLTEGLVEQALSPAYAPAAR
jgi:hypothetical protein